MDANEGSKEEPHYTCSTSGIRSRVCSQHPCRPRERKIGPAWVSVCLVQYFCATCSTRWAAVVVRTIPRCFDIFMCAIQRWWVYTTLFRRLRGIFFSLQDRLSSLRKQMSSKGPHCTIEACDRIQGAGHRFTTMPEPSVEDFDSGPIAADRDTVDDSSNSEIPRMRS